MGQEAMLLSCGWDGVQVGDLREGGGRTPPWDVPSATKQRALQCWLDQVESGPGQGLGDSRNTHWEEHLAV